MTVIGTLVIDA